MAEATTITTTTMNPANSNHAEIDEDWEEWDGKSPFLHHCIAGSLAGLTEHTIVYPLDTIRTHIQACASCEYLPKATSTAASTAASRSSSATASTAATTTTTTPFTTAQHATSKSHVARAASAARPGTLPRFAASSASPPPALPQGVWQTMRYLMSEPALSATTATANAVEEVAAATTSAVTKPQEAAGFMRLWRGVQTMVIGCIPAHALYFSSYEAVKASFKTPENPELVWYGSMLAGATATLGHDVIISPLDTVKQRLQLGHYEGSMGTALKQMMQKEGVIALYRSFPITLFANVPYGMIMVSTNEGLKQAWTDRGQPLTLYTTLLASSAAGFVASATTTPLDRIKTLLQTQQMAPACWPTPPDNCPQKAVVEQWPIVNNAYEALTRILTTEGAVGLFRGVVPRVLSHTPAVAISWTTYETAKNILGAST